MKDIREMLNISYFDNKELSLKEHCDIYSNIRKDLISVLTKYDIKYTIADTESIRDLSKEIQELKKQLKDKQQNYSNLAYMVTDQRDKFIEYLENMIKEMENTPADDIHQQVEKDSCLTVVNTILSKYKETIGDDK